MASNGEVFPADLQILQLKVSKNIIKRKMPENANILDGYSEGN